MYRLRYWSQASVSLSLAIFLTSCGADGAGPDGPRGEDAAIGDGVAASDGGATSRGDAATGPARDAGSDEPIVQQPPAPALDAVLVVTGSVVGRLSPTRDSAFIRALCSYYARCEPGFFPGLSLDECRALLSQPCLAVPYVVLNDDDGGDDCVEKFANASCADSFAGGIATGACAEAFDRGTARLAGVASLHGPGESCGDGQGCKVGNVCTRAGSDSCGTCVALKGEGAACEVGECLDGGCVAGRCVAPAASGQRCLTEAAAGQPSSYYCAGGLVCGANGRCKPLASDGQACSDSAECYGRRCVSGTCDDLSAYGADCVEDAECASAACFGGRCAVVASCAPGAEGDPCVASDSGECGPDLYCVAHRCTAETPADCTTTGCNASTYCDTTRAPAACVAQKAGGATCAEAGECALGTCSAAMRCEALGTFGICDQDPDCLHGTCVDRYCRGGSICE